MYKNELEKYTRAKDSITDYPSKDSYRYSGGAPNKKDPNQWRS